MTMDHTLADLYRVVTSKGFGVGQKFESHPFHSLVCAQEAAVNQLNVMHPEAVKLFILVGMMPAGIMDTDLETIWGHSWHYLAKILIDRDLIRKKESQTKFTNSFRSQNNNSASKSKEKTI